MTKSTVRLFTVAAFALLFSACSNNAVKVTAKFANTQDIKEGTAVYFENEIIGQVSDVSNKSNGALIELELDKSAAELVDSSAAIVVNRLKQGAPLELYNRETGDASPIQDGQELKGFDSMFQLGAWMVGDAIQVGSSSVSEYISSFQDYLKGEQFQKDKDQVKKQIGEATSAAKGALEQIETDLNKAVKDLNSQEGETAKTIEQLGEELSPLVEELAKSGLELTEQLEQFTEGLKSAENDEQQAGQTLMDSLIAMLEKLNDSMEKGMNESSDNENQNSAEGSNADSKSEPESHSL